MRVAGGRRVSQTECIQFAKSDVTLTCAWPRAGADVRPRVATHKHHAQLAAEASSEEEPAASVGSRKRARSKSDAGSKGSRKRANNLEVGGLALTAPAFLPSRPAAAPGPQAATNLKAAPNSARVKEVERQRYQLFRKAHLSEAEQNLAHWTKEVECRRFRLAADSVEEVNGQLLKNQSHTAHKEGSPSSQELTKKDPNIFTVFVKCWLPPGQGCSKWARDLDFQSLTRRPRYICERYTYLTTVGDLKAKIVDTIGNAIALQKMVILFRGQSLANDDILHSLIDDEVIAHACARDANHVNTLAAAVREASKQLWSMA